MEDPGEKIVSTPTVFGGVVYFTSFVPGADTSSSDTCGGAGNGTAYLWAVNYKTGEAVFEYNGVSGLTKEDRRVGIGSGMPSESVVIVTSEGTFIGAATQNKIPLKATSETRGVYKYFWRQK